MARTAGSAAAARVTTSPTRTASTAPMASMRIGRLPGRRRPSPSSPLSAPHPRSHPAPMPRVPATMPTSAASTSTDPANWARLAPTARRRACSRIRWDTRIPNVLVMMNADTNRAMAENSSSSAVKNRMRSRNSAASSSSTSAIVFTVRSGTAASMRSVSSSGDTPSAAMTSTPSRRPSSPARIWACSTVTAMAPGRPSPKSTASWSVSPTRSMVCWPAGVSTWISSPTENPFSSACWTSMTSSPSASGPSPSATSARPNRGLDGHERTKRPCQPRTCSPCGSRSTIWLVKFRPPTASTPSTAAT